MTTLLVKFVASASTFMLLLPAGWCRGWDCCQTKVASAAVSLEISADSSAAAPSKPAAKGCCLKRAEAEASHSKNLAVEYVRATSPAHSTVDCCCTRGKLVTNKVSVAAPDELSGSSLAAITPVLSMVSDQLPVAVVVVSPSAAGPPLRVLHCVWRC